MRDGRGRSATWPKNLKRTRSREQVLAVLEDASFPLSAIDIFQSLEKRGTPLWLSTIYRVLDSFTGCGMAAKTELADSPMSFYELAGGGHRHYAVCLACRQMIALRECPLESRTPQLTDENFQIIGHKLQMYGYCAKCRPE